MKKMLFILGTDLGGKTGLNDVTCMGLLRLTIQDKCGYNDPKAVEAYLNKMGFDEWEKILDDPVLASRIANLGIKNNVAILAQVKKTLLEKRSLFTMS